MLTVREVGHKLLALSQLKNYGYCIQFLKRVIVHKRTQVSILRFVFMSRHAEQGKVQFDIMSAIVKGMGPMSTILAS